MKMKTTRIMAPAITAVLIFTGGCSFMQGVGEVGEGVGGAIGKLVTDTGRAVKNAAKRAQNRNDRRNRAKRRAQSSSSRTVYSSQPVVVASGSPELRQAQQTLNGLGYNTGRPDGLMGGKTRRALREFQQDQGLAVTGRLDDDTLLALRNSTDADRRPARRRSVKKSRPEQRSAQKTPATTAERRESSEATEQASPEPPAAVPAKPVSLGKARISSDTQMKSAADPFSSDVLTLKTGASVNLLEKTGDFYKVEYQGKTGYVFAEFVGR